MQLTKTYNGVPVEIYGSLGDIEAFENLSEDVQKKILRLFEVDGVGEFSRTEHMYTEAQMIEAYEAGFEDCADHMSEPWLDITSARRWVQDLR